MYHRTNQISITIHIAWQTFPFFLKKKKKEDAALWLFVSVTQHWSAYILFILQLKALAFRFFNSEE